LLTFDYFNVSAYSGESLQLQNLPEAAEIEIYDLSGKLITNQAASFQYVSNLRASKWKRGGS
jgi:hypothetical protein